jgi:hypothetical protein
MRCVRVSGHYPALDGPLSLTRASRLGQQSLSSGKVRACAREVCRRDGGVRAAERVYEQHRRMSDQDGEVRAEIDYRGIMLKGCVRWSQAEEAADQALFLAPRLTKARFRRGVARKGQRRYEVAIKGAFADISSSSPMLMFVNGMASIQTSRQSCGKTRTAQRPWRSLRRPTRSLTKFSERRRIARGRNGSPH